MIITSTLGWEGYFEEHNCLGKEKTYCAAFKGMSTYRDYYCYGLLINKRCYKQSVEKTDDGEGKVIKEEVYCR